MLKGKPIVSRCIGGQTAPQMLLRFYADVVALHPKAVHIMDGTSDVARNTGPSSDTAIEHNVRAMTGLSRANVISVILATIVG